MRIKSSHALAIVLLASFFTSSFDRVYAAKDCSLFLAKSKEQLAKQAGLHYTTGEDLDAKGITRKVLSKSVSYYDAKGRKITDEKTLDRISALNIPVVYSDVWISPDPLSHIQAIAYDSRGRPQYRYHPKWIEMTSGYKFSKMAQFGSSIPKIHKKVDADLSEDGMPKEKVEAAIVKLLETSGTRVGNEKYAKENETYGLTTMLKKHVVKLGTTKVTLDFVGKADVPHIVEIDDPDIVKLIRALMKEPGKNLFQYEDESGAMHKITSSEVSAYIAEAGEGKFSAKDFRTWVGTVKAAEELYAAGTPADEKESKEVIKSAMEAVSEKLGNTPDIAKKNYVAPEVIEAYLDGTLPKYFAKAKKNGIKGLSQAETATVLLLKE